MDCSKKIFLSSPRISLLGLWVMLALLCSLGNAVFQLGSCPSSVSVISNFNISQYTGLWYENRKYFVIYELGQRCVTATYTLNSDGSTVTVLNQSKLGTKPVSITGRARQLSPPSAKLGVTFSSIPFSRADAPYWVLDTDYTSYAVVWSCTTTAALFNSRTVWILTRAQSPNSTTVDKALAVLDKNGIDRSYLKQTEQFNC